MHVQFASVSSEWWDLSLPVGSHFEEEGSTKPFTINLHFNVVFWKKMFFFFLITCQQNTLFPPLSNDIAP